MTAAASNGGIDYPTFFLQRSNLFQSVLSNQPRNPLPTHDIMSHPIVPLPEILILCVYIHIGIHIECINIRKLIV